MTSAAKLSAFQVPLTMHLLSACVHRFPSWWIRLGDLETRSLRGQLESIDIDRPVYVTGIARAGTTILLELLARHERVATHQYRDFPGQFVPVWWNRNESRQIGGPQERAHGDRLMVTEESPEAMEETLWAAFFPSLHDPYRNNVLDGDVENARFENFYQDHLRKLLLTRGKTRYVAKGNYNLTRLAYLHKILPDARFVVVVRNPRDHVASLIKQHRLFCAGETAYPRALAHMQRVGHFEFGLDRRPINVGDGVAEEVVELWQRGDEVRGTSRYWASLYGWIAHQLEQQPGLAEAVKILRYEDLCADPEATVCDLLDHCRLPPSTAVQQFTAQIAAPEYYCPDFSESDEGVIVEETSQVAAHFGYEAALVG